MSLPKLYNRKYSVKLCYLNVCHGSNQPSSSDTFIEFLISQLYLGYIHLSWDVVIIRIRFGGLIYSLESFLKLNMCRELQIFAFVYTYSGASQVFLDFVTVTLELLP
jgi:hypothetical protein